MTGPTSGPRPLETQLCPWLLPALRQLEAARAGGRLGHAWLLAGPAGVGKLNLALVLATRLLGRDDAVGDPPELGAAEAAAAMRDRHAPHDHHPDLHWLFPGKGEDREDDATENGKGRAKEKRTITVEQVRDVIAALALTAHGGRAKVVVVEPADALTVAAANALLKTLEEPSEDTYLLLLSHQPERLPATIRSRCQRLPLAAPHAPALRRWLEGIDTEQFAALWLATGGAPLAMAGLRLGEDFNKTKEVLQKLPFISQDRADVQAVAAAWAKPDTIELALTWLTRLLHREIRARLVPDVSTSITDPTGGVLHNAWAELTLRHLFGQYERTEQLLTRLGGGTNMELAVHALLLGFQAEREQS